MRKIVGKGWISQLKALEDIGFDSVELSLTADPDIRENPRKTGLDIYTMHEFKGNFQVGNHRLWGNIGDNHSFGDISEALLKKHVEYAKEYGIPRLVIHPGFVNRFVADKEAAIETAAKRLARIYDPEVKLCMENSDFRPDLTAYANERLVVGSNDVKSLFEKCDAPLHLIVDTEHLHNAAIFSHFYDVFKPLYELVQNEEEKELADRYAIKMMSDFVVQNPVVAKNIVEEFMTDYFNTYPDLIEGIHVCGTDYHKYRPPKEEAEVEGFNPKVQLGSHLPIGFKGTLEGESVQDRLDYELVMKLSDAPMIIEVTDKGLPEGYVYWANESRKELHRIVGNIYK